MKHIHSPICGDVTLCKGNGSSTHCQYFKLKVPSFTLGRFHLDFFIINSTDKLFCFVIPQTLSFKRRKWAFLQVLLPMVFSLGIYIFVTRSTEKTHSCPRAAFTHPEFHLPKDPRCEAHQYQEHGSYTDSFHARNEENAPAAGNPPDLGVSPTIREKWQLC